MGKSFVFSSESVGEGHPDKVADLISDSVLDACLRVDRLSRVACETLVKSNAVVVAGAEVMNAPTARKATSSVSDCFCNVMSRPTFAAPTIRPGTPRSCA